MLRVALKAVELINEQIREGKDADGKSYAYSEKPFVMPSGAARLKKQASLEKEGKIARFTTKQGSLWILVFGGYKSLREMRGQNSDGDFLQDTGAMLRSMSAEETSATEARVVFSDPKSAQKAFWLSVSGAGRSRKLWKFFGLSKENRQKLEEFAAEELGTGSSGVTDRIINTLTAGIS